MPIVTQNRKHWQIQTNSRPLEVFSNENLTSFKSGWEVLPPNFTLREPGPVRLYTEQHPSIQEFFVKSLPIIRKYFGENVEVVLEIIKYPDSNAYDEIVGWIQSTDDIEKGLEKLECIENELLLQDITCFDNTANFNIEFL